MFSKPRAITQSASTWLKVQRALRRSDFISMLVLSEDQGPRYQSDRIYAWFRLGCYLHVVTSGHQPGTARDVTAVAVSLATLGRFDDCTQCVQDGLALLAHSQKHALEAARGLAKFRPDLALQILETAPGNWDFRAALHLERGDTDIARSLIARTGKPSKAQLVGGHYFVRANMAPDRHDRQKLINEQLAGFALAPLKTKNNDGPCVRHLAPEDAVKPVPGPLVSVIVPAFDCQELLTSTVQSLLDQSYADLEIVIVDDGSRDGTAAVAQTLCNRDQRVKLISLETNAGAYAARNAGLTASTGCFVTVNDADDFAHPQKIARQVAPLLDDEDMVFTLSDLVRVSHDGVIGPTDIYPVQRLNTSSLTFRKATVLRDCGCWDTVRFGADSEFLFRLKQFYSHDRWRRLRQPLTFASQHAGSLTRTVPTGGRDLGADPRRVHYTESYVLRHLQQVRAAQVGRR
jgi:hypothetical protein